MGKQAVIREWVWKRYGRRTGPNRDGWLDGPWRMVEEEVRSPLHKHPLKLTTKGGEERFPCDGCRDDDMSGTIYGCRPCLVFLHKPCTELPERIWRSSHPCPLVLAISRRFSCDACGCWDEGFAYRCLQCGFSLDLVCARDTEEEFREEMKHFSHPHGLVPYGRKEACDFCEQNTECPLYQCGARGCSFALHLSCSHVLSSATAKIHHGSHPSCSLILFYMMC